MRRGTIISFILSLTTLLICNSARSESLDTSLSNDSLRLQYTSSLQSNDLNISADFLHHEDDGDLGGIGLFVSGSSSLRKSGVGGKFIYFNSESIDGAALALGGFFRHTLSAANLISIRGDLYYAPGVVAFNDADRYFEISLRIEYKLMDRADIFVGARKVEIGLDKAGDADVDKGAYAGLIIHF
ncbi:MAG: YfaZ family protein [Pseudomonadales bacterium]|nr:YfaZ family protein [Pseudomonadales bacterium]